MPYRPSRGPRIFAPLFIALLVLVALLAAVAWVPIRHARDEWRAGRNAEAITKAAQWSRLRLWGRQYDQLLAAALLTVGNTNGAKAHLDAIEGKRMWLSAVRKEEVARRLIARGRYAEFLAYDRASRDLREHDDVNLYRAAALLATNRVTEAETIFKAMDASDHDPKMIEALSRGIQQRKEGSYPFVTDRDGKTIAAFQIANSDVVAINRDFEPLVEREAGNLTIEARMPRTAGSTSLETTLDSEVQKAAVRALGGFRGSLVAIDPRTNEILAIASNRNNGELRNLALEAFYEPGSVIKVLTGMNAVANGVDLKGMFPYQCTGNLAIDGRSFGDWIPAGHGHVASFDEALAESCNVVFADIGVRLGVDQLRKFMTSAGFGGKANLGVFQVPLGRTVGPIFNKFETAFYAIGLEHETVNTLHLAMLASMVANRGVLTAPQLMRARRSILGEVIEQPPAQAKVRVASQEATDRMIQAMKAVVTHPQGTGRRAPVDGVSLAMKTGTAGEERDGYTALIVAFAPAEAPKIAFALIAENAGSAEYAGSKIAHDFMAGIRGRL